MGIKIIAENKKARFDYSIVDTMEVGLVLTGSEVKSLRNGQITLKDSYISFKGNEAFLQNAHISEYKASSYNNHDPERLRKVLMHRMELDRLFANIREQGLSVVPLKLYFKKGRVKMEIGLARGKKKGDKREAAKSKSIKKEIAQTLKKSR